MTKRLALYALGTRGDVQPAIALGRGLQLAGYDVRVAVSSVHGHVVAEHGLTPAVIDVDTREMMTSDAGMEWVESGRNPWRELFVMRRLMDSRAAAAAPDTLRIARDSDLLVTGFVTVAIVQAVAEKLDRPWINASLQPSLRSADGASLLYPVLPNRVSRINAWSSRVSEAIIWFVYRNSANRVRRELLDLPTHSFRSFNAAFRSAPMVFGYSPHVVPHPRDWPPNAHTTGYWFHHASREWQPPERLASFLASGPAPVYVGFGSMTWRDPEHVTRIVFEALADAGARGVVSGGWAGLRAADVPSHVCLVDDVPHDWLFPRTAGVVHHGGAGTTATGLWAGVPTTVVPHFGDQSFWGRRVHALGAGPAPIPRHKLTPSNLAEAIREMVSSADMSSHADDLGRRIRAEDGVARAVAVIDDVVRGMRPW